MRSSPVVCFVCEIVMRKDNTESLRFSALLACVKKETFMRSYRML